MVRKFFIALLCFMFVPIVCSQALGASAWYVTALQDDTSITYATDSTTTEYNSSKWSSATADTSTKTFKDFFANKVNAGDTVYIKDGTFTITGSNTIKIEKNVTVYGGFKESDSGIDSRTGSTIIQGGTGFSSKVIEISSSKITVSLDGLTITGGNGGKGSGVDNNSSSSTLTMTNCTIANNTATGSNNGGGVSNSGMLTMTNCTVSGNTAGNRGGGVYNSGKLLTMTNCTVSGNTATGKGGGVYSSSTLTMTNCTIANNTATGSNDGGGVYNSGNLLTMTNCTVTGNTAGSNGGGVYNSSNTLTMTNTFVWGDTPDKLIYNDGNAITAVYSAFPSGLSVTGITLDDTTQNNIAIASWSSQTSKDVTINGVTHTVYRIEDNSELSSLEGAGSVNVAPAQDQIGHTRNNPPCIGAVEVYYAPEIPAALTIDATEGESITQTITAAKGSNIVWSTSGTLPDGLLTASSDTTFTILGTPKTGTAANSPYTYTVTAKNDADEAQTVVTINVTAAPVLSCDNVIILTEGEKMTDFTITATNGNSVTWSSSGTLPDGVTSSNNDNTFTITGTPSDGTASSSPYKYTVTAENTAGKTQAFITIIVTAKSVGSSPVAPVLFETDIAYSSYESSDIYPIRIIATSGTNLTWSSSGTLPDGLEVSSKDNVFSITGTLKEGTAADSPYKYTVTAANSLGTAEAKVTIIVKEREQEDSTPVAPVLFESEIAYTGIENGEIYPIRAIATAGTNLTWSASGNLPEGLTVSDQDNVFSITGTPASGTAANSPYIYTVTAMNSAGQASAQITITINGSGSPVKPVLSEPEINYTDQEGYTIQAIVIRATAGNDLTWSSSGALPNVLKGAESDNGMSYTISGKLSMNTEGSYSYTVTAKNGAGEASSVVNITVEKFSINPDTTTEPATEQTLGEYLSKTLGLSSEQLKTVEDFKVPSKITDLSGIAELMPNLKTLDLTAADSLGENIDLSVLGNLTLERVTLSGNSAVKTLNLKNCNIQNVNAEGCTELVSIDIAGNEFIEKLQVGSTDISEINANGCKKLKTLNCANSKVSKLDLTGCVEMRDLDFKNNRVRRFHKDDFALDKLSKLNAKGQRANKSLIEKIFDLVAFMFGNDEGGISTAGIVINSAVNSGDENLISITGYDESGSKIDCDYYSTYPETGEVIFDKAPATIIYNYYTGVNSMDVTISGNPDDDGESALGNSSGGCDSGFASGALLMLTGLALIHRKKQ